MKEERSLTYAKQSFKRNIDKYSIAESLLVAIYENGLRIDELDSLKEYAIKLLPNDEYIINLTIDDYKKECME